MKYSSLHDGVKIMKQWMEEVQTEGLHESCCSPDNDVEITAGDGHDSGGKLKYK
jgi:hypothetical protein